MPGPPAKIVPDRTGWSHCPSVRTLLGETAGRASLCFPTHGGVLKLDWPHRGSADMGRWRERRRSSFRALGRSRSLANGINVRPSHGGGIARAMSSATVAALLFLSGVAQPPTDLASESQRSEERRVGKECVNTGK